MIQLAHIPGTHPRHSRCRRFFFGSATIVTEVCAFRRRLFINGVAGSNANLAWDTGFCGAGKIVAVIDTGYRPHADLNANVINGYDFTGNVATANDGNGRDSSALDPGDWSTAGQLVQVSWRAIPAGKAPMWPTLSLR